MTRIVIRSEREAWEYVKRCNAAAQRRGATVDDLRAMFIECDIVADNMLDQLTEGIHKNPSKRDAGTVRVVNGVAYMPTWDSAEMLRKLWTGPKFFPEYAATSRVVEYEKGFAVQTRKSGDYFSPRGVPSMQERVNRL